MDAATCPGFHFLMACRDRLPPLIRTLAAARAPVADGIGWLPFTSSHSRPCARSVYAVGTFLLANVTAAVPATRRLSRLASHARLSLFEDMHAGADTLSLRSIPS